MHRIFITGLKMKSCFKPKVTSLRTKVCQKLKGWGQPKIYLLFYSITKFRCQVSLSFEKIPIQRFSLAITESKDNELNHFKNKYFAAIYRSNEKYIRRTRSWADAARVR